MGPDQQLEGSFFHIFFVISPSSRLVVTAMLLWSFPLAPSLAKCLDCKQSTGLQLHFAALCCSFYLYDHICQTYYNKSSKISKFSEWVRYRLTRINNARSIPLCHYALRPDKERCLLCVSATLQKIRRSGSVRSSLGSKNYLAYFFRWGGTHTHIHTPSWPGVISSASSTLQSQHIRKVPLFSVFFSVFWTK